MGSTSLQVRTFIRVAYDYLQNRTDKNSVHLQRQLQILSVVSDLSIFEPTASETLEFYMCLEKFLTPTEGRSTVAGKVVALLAHVCNSPTIRLALRDDIKIIPVLSDFLVNSKLSKDKLLKSLSLLKTISYGIKIVRLEAWTMKVVPFLVSTITEGTIGDDSLLVALQALANLCRSNPPVLGCLLKLDSCKMLVKTLSRLKNATMDIKLLATEMVLHLDPKMEDIDFVDVLDMIFTVAIEGFAENNASWLQLAADVFGELMLLPATEYCLKEYKNYEANLQPLLNGMGCGSPEPLIEALLDFLGHLSELNHPHIKSLHEDIFLKVLKWTHSERCGAAAIRVAKGILMTSSDSLTSTCMDDLILGIKACLKSDEDSSMSLGKLHHLITIISLLEQLCSSSEPLRLKFAMELEPRIFSTLLMRVLTLTTGCQNMELPVGKSGADSTFASSYDSTITWQYGKATSSSEVSALSMSDLKASLRETQSQAVVMILTIVKGLSSMKVEYMTQYNEMVSKPAVMNHLVQCEHSGTAEFVARAWAIISGGCFPKECLDALVAASEEANSSGLRSNNHSYQQRLFSSRSHMPILSPNIEDKVDTMISWLKGTVEKMELKDCALTDMIEMYEYKLATMAHREQSLADALTAADMLNRQTSYSHLQTKMQNDHVRRLLDVWVTRYQTSQAEKTEIQGSILEIQESARQLRENFINEKQQLEKRQKEMKKEVHAVKDSLEASEENERRLQRQLSQAGDEAKTLHQQIKEEQEKGQKLSIRLQKLEEELKQGRRDNEDLKKELETLEKNRLQLKKENTDLELLVKSHEESMAAKEEELEETTKKLNKMKQIQKMVHDIYSRDVLQ